MKAIFFAAAIAFTFSGASAFADGIPKFGKTCVGKSGWNANVCVSSNGKSLSSSYDWKGRVATKGTHTRCQLSGSTILCAGGTFKTASGSGKMDPVRVKLKDGKPTSVKWN